MKNERLAKVMGLAAFALLSSGCHFDVHLFGKEQKPAASPVVLPVGPDDGPTEEIIAPPIEKIETQRSSGKRAYT